MLGMILGHWDKFNFKLLFLLIGPSYKLLNHWKTTILFKSKKEISKQSDLNNFIICKKKHLNENSEKQT